MKFLKTFEDIDPIPFSGGDVTKMPIIGQVITLPIGPYKSNQYDVVEIIDTPQGAIYVTNQWYKEHKRIPQLIHCELVDQFIGV